MSSKDKTPDDVMYNVPTWAIQKPVRAKTKLKIKKGTTWVCPSCIKWYTYQSKWTQPTKDHIIPKSKGGSNRVENIRIICRKCNNDRGNKPLI